MDILLLHVPKIHPEEQQAIYILPSGLFSIADTLDREGFSTRIVHYGLKTLHDSRFTLEGYLKTHSPKVIGFSLHWHYQIADVLDVARRAKDALPESSIVFGGYTASAFHRELLERFPFVDAVVRGDGEQPLATFAESVCRGGVSLESVPNLCWRREGEVTCNPIGYCGSTENASQSSHVRVDLLEDARDYFEKYLFFDEDIYDLTNCFYYTTGRGCPVSCSHCGGGRPAQKRLFERPKHFLFDHEKVLRDFETLYNYGVRSLRLCYDPEPYGDYYAELFEKVRAKNLKFRMVFEAWALPNDRFMKSFAEAFTADSLLILSPECGSEKVRRRNKGFYYTNRELLDTLDRAHSHGISTSLFFTFGLPFETQEDLSRTLDLVHLCREKGAHCRALPMFLDPYSPVFLDPERFGIETHMKTMEHFIEEHARHAPRLNYCTRHLSEQQILDGIEAIGRIGGASPTQQAALESWEKPTPEDSLGTIRDFKRTLDRDLELEKQRLRLFRSLLKTFGPLLSGRKGFSNGFRFSRISKETDYRILVEWRRGEEQISTLFVSPDYEGPTILRNRWMGVYLYNPNRDPNVERAFRELEPEMRAMLDLSPMESLVEN